MRGFSRLGSASDSSGDSRAQGILRPRSPSAGRRMRSNTARPPPPARRSPSSG